ncbi:MAG: hypothetical protein ACOC3W_00860 [Thermodesulfobacteriota bacterium]
MKGKENTCDALWRRMKNCCKYQCIGHGTRNEIGTDETCTATLGKSGRLRSQKMIEWITDWVQAHETLLWILGSFSFLIFVLSLVGLPIIIIKMPRNYLSSPDIRSFKHGSAWDRTYLVGKNIIAVLLILAGLAMLLLPGQGLLTLVIGLSMLDFPRKRMLIKKILAHKKVLGTANWLREKGGKPPLEAPA